MLDNEDFSTFAKIGQALWVVPEIYKRSTLETLAAVSLLNLSPEDTLERACLSLLEREKGNRFSSEFRTNFSINSAALGEPFFRLSAEERIALVAIHCGQWSYQRLCRIFKKDREDIEKLLWRARLQLIAPFSLYPAGPSTQGPSCPEYQEDSPWTQRFLDHEVSSPGNEFFLQNHLLGCTKCRQTLGRCREVYFKIDEEIKKKLIQTDLTETLKKTIQNRPYKKSKIELGFFETLKIFVRNSDVQWVLTLVSLIILSKVLFSV